MALGDSALGSHEVGDREARDYWRINGDPVAREVTGEVRGFGSLEITFTTPLEAVTQVFRPLRKNAGSVETLEASDGALIGVDTADGNNTLTLDAPANRQAVRRQREWLVDDYDEEMLDQQGEKYEIELELVPARSKRQYSGHTGETAAADEWLLEFDAGAIATAAVSSEIVETSTDGVETIGLNMRLGPQQVRKLEESARKLAAVKVDKAFDGTSTVEDNSPEQVNVFGLTPPEGGDKTVDPGHYVVNGDYDVEWAGGVYDVELEALSIDLETFHSAGYIADAFASN